MRAPTFPNGSCRHHQPFRQFLDAEECHLHPQCYNWAVRRASECRQRIWSGLLIRLHEVPEVQGGNPMMMLPRAGHFFLVSAVSFLLLTCGSVLGQSQQEHVHNMSHSVMPFEMAKTVHIFKMTDSGGVQRVVVRDSGYADQVTLIQQHLQKEAGRFRQGNYSDPAALHGNEMLGIKELQLGAKRVKVSYTSLPEGAEIRFETTDLHLVTALHRWFGAQLSEHGADARAE